MDLFLFLLVMAVTAGVLTVAAFFNLLRSHVAHRAAGLAITFFVGAVTGFMTAILMGVLTAAFLEADGRLEPISAALFLGFVWVMSVIGGVLAVKAMARILHWRPQAKS